jgi:hypothetical protein
MGVRIPPRLPLICSRDAIWQTSKAQTFRSGGSNPLASTNLAGMAQSADAADLRSVTLRVRVSLPAPVAH